MEKKMIKYLLVLSSVLYLISFHAMADVNFKVQTIKTTLTEAKNEKKLILSVCSAKECRFCVWMDKNVYNDPYLSQTINQKLIPIKPTAQMDRMEWMKNCTSLPTMIFIDENGKVVRKEEGKKTLIEMNQIVKEVLASNCTPLNEKMDESLGTKKASTCCEGLVKETQVGGQVCVNPTCIETSTRGIPLKVHLKETPPCCDPSAEKEVTFGGISHIRCMPPRLNKRINQSNRGFSKPKENKIENTNNLDSKPGVNSH
jgi:hypothetical protein